MKITFVLFFLFFAQAILAETPGGLFVQSLIKSRPEFEKNLGNRKINEFDTKNVVASWIKGYIDLAHREKNILIVFDPSKPSGDHLCEYSTRSIPERGEIVSVRVAIISNVRFEDIFFTLVSSIIKARNDETIQNLKRRFFEGDSIDQNEILLEFMKLNHLVLFEIHELRKKDFNKWGVDHKILTSHPVWDGVKEKEFDEWIKSADNLKLRKQLQSQAEASYNSWKDTIMKTNQ